MHHVSLCCVHIVRLRMSLRRLRMRHIPHHRPPKDNLICAPYVRHVQNLCGPTDATITSLLAFLILTPAVYERNVPQHQVPRPYRGSLSHLQCVRVQPHQGHTRIALHLYRDACNSISSLRNAIKNQNGYMLALQYLEVCKCGYYIKQPICLRRYSIVHPSPSHSMVASVDPTYPLYTIASVLAAAMLLLVFLTSFIRQSWNLGLAFLCFWLFFENLTNGVNAIIWSDNADLKLFGYCDIGWHIPLTLRVVRH